MDREIDRRIGAAAAVMRSMYRSVVVKKELSQKVKLSIYQSIYVPTLTYGHELWVMTERVRSRIQAAEMSFLRTVAGRSLRDRVRSSVTREELGVEPLLLHIERGQLRWLGHLFRMPPRRLPGEVFRACPTGKRPRGRPRTHWRDYVSRLAWERLGVPPEELEDMSGEKEVWAINGVLNAETYRQILIHHVISSRRCLFGPKFILQQENDPKRIANVNKNYLQHREEEEALEVMVRPPQSPDLNIIQSVWDYMKRQRDLRQSTSIKDWNNLPAEFLLKLCASFLSETLSFLTLEAEAGDNVTIWCQHDLTVTSFIFWFKHTSDSVPLLLGCKQFRTSAPSQLCYFFNESSVSPAVFFILIVVFGAVIVFLLGVLIFIVLKHRKTHRGAKDKAEVNEVSDPDSVNYAALQFSKKKTKRNKRHDVKEDPHVVYSSVGQRNVCT
ncbi:hypothetical protein QTP70_000706 [Hemibagrus guttatus]|uniref:Uncharacterized protein n=1 Tax=Hemibagrus guttatus TaxID=175788 RepID=A0AAE0UQM6_9TELE|nr:hypothetical protein QTP70_000706 [Hemibagrus guttatus]